MIIVITFALYVLSIILVVDWQCCCQHGKLARSRSGWYLPKPPELLVV